MKVEMQFFSFAATSWWLLFFCFGKKSKKENNFDCVLFGIAPKSNQKGLALGKITYPSSDRI
jgi:hypothetical protein